MAGLVGRVVGGDHGVAGPGREAVEAVVGVEVRHVGRPLRQEPLARRLLRDAHRPPDVGPRGAGPPGLVDEVPDEVIGQLAEVIGGDHGAGQLLQLVVVDLADGGDEVVEADGRRDRGGHATTIGCRRVRRQPSVVDQPARTPRCPTAPRSPTHRLRAAHARARRSREGHGGHLGRRRSPPRRGPHRDRAARAAPRSSTTRCSARCARRSASASLAATWRHLDALDRERTAARARAPRALRRSRSSRARARSTTTPRASRSPTCSTASATRPRSIAAGTALAPNAEAFLRSARRCARSSAITPSGSTRTGEIADRCRFSLAELRYRFPSEHALQARRDARRSAPPAHRRGLPRRATQRARRRPFARRSRRSSRSSPSSRSRRTSSSVRADRRHGAPAATSSARAGAARRTAPSASRSASPRSIPRARTCSSSASSPPSAREPPDIDVDFEHERREEVIQEIYETLRARSRGDGLARSSATAARARCARWARSSASRSSRSIA